MAQLLRSIEIVPINDTRIESANPNTNFRSSDLALGLGINFLLTMPKTGFLSSLYFDSSSFVSAKLKLVPKSSLAAEPDNIEIYAYAINNVTLDLRNATWNSYNGADNWITPGGLGNKDSSSESRSIYQHYVGVPIEVDITEPVRSNLDKGGSMQLILSGAGPEIWSYHDLAATIETNRPIIIVYYKSYQDSWRLGSPSVPTMPSL